MSIVEIMSDLYMISFSIRYGELVEKDLDKMYNYKNKLIELYEKLYKN